jgi:hypothetical protein
MPPRTYHIRYDLFDRTTDIHALLHTSRTHSTSCISPLTTTAFLHTNQSSQYSPLVISSPPFPINQTNVTSLLFFSFISFFLSSPYRLLIIIIIILLSLSSYYHYHLIIIIILLSLSSYYHLIIILLSSYYHLIIILLSSYYRLIIVLLSSYYRLIIVLSSYFSYFHHLIIILLSSYCHLIIISSAYHLISYLFLTSFTLILAYPQNFPTTQK